MGKFTDLYLYKWRNDKWICHSVSTWPEDIVLQIGDQVSIKSKNIWQVHLVWESHGQMFRRVESGWPFHFHKYWTFGAGLSILEMNFTDLLDHFHHSEICLFPLPSLGTLLTSPRDSVFRLISAWVTTHDYCILHTLKPAHSVNTFCIASKLELVISLEMWIWAGKFQSSAFLRLFNQVSKFWKYF